MMANDVDGDIDVGIDTDMDVVDIDTRLCMATKCRLVGSDIVQTLLEMGAAVNKHDHYGTPLHYACMKGLEGKVHLLLHWGADACAETVDGQSTIALCVKGGECLDGGYSCVQHLAIAQRERPEWKWERDIQVAEIHGRPDIAKLILQCRSWSTYRCSWIAACVRITLLHGTQSIRTGAHASSQ